MLPWGVLQFQRLQLRPIKRTDFNVRFSFLKKTIERLKLPANQVFIASVEEGVEDFDIANDVDIAKEIDSRAKGVANRIAERTQELKKSLRLRNLSIAAAVAVILASGAYSWYRLFGDKK